MADVRIIQGPLVNDVSREDAEARLKTHPNFPKNASVAIDAVEGRWVAAYTVVAEFPPSEDSADPTAPEAPEDSKPEGPPEGDSGDDSGDSGEKKPSKEKGEHGELGQIKEMLTTLLTALGLGAPADGMVPGMDDPMGAPPGAPPGPPAGGPPDKNHIVHERALKPGEAPPGTTPVGAPSFASVSENHPWYHQIVAGSKEWELEEPLDNGTTMSVIASELRALAEPVDCRIAEVKIEKEGTTRIARAKIVRN